VTTASILSSPSAQQTVLYVGDLLSFVDGDLRRAGAPRSVFAAFVDVTFDLLEDLNPDTIVCPLLADDFDAAELAELLSCLGFGGDFVVIAPPVPNIQLVAGDISVLAPGVNVDVRVFWRH